MKILKLITFYLLTHLHGYSQDTNSIHGYLIYNFKIYDNKCIKKIIKKR